jgi:hypothetical protein
MWLPGTKGTTNGGGVGGVKFFAEKSPNFFGGQKSTRKIRAAKRRADVRPPGFQSENGEEGSASLCAKSFLTLAPRKPARGFRGEFLSREK